MAGMCGAQRLCERGEIRTHPTGLTRHDELEICKKHHTAGFPSGAVVEELRGELHQGPCCAVLVSPVKQPLKGFRK